MQAPADVTFPYGVFTWDGSTIDEICGGASDRIETAQITVYLYSKNDDGATQLCTICTAFTALFDWCALSFPSGSTYSPLACRRNSIVNRGKVDNIWLFELEYSVIYSH